MFNIILKECRDTGETDAVRIFNHWSSIKQEPGESLASIFNRYQAAANELKGTKLTYDDLINLKFITILSNSDAVQQYNVREKADPSKPASFVEAHAWFKRFEANGVRSSDSTSVSDDNQAMFRKEMQSRLHPVHYPNLRSRN